MDDDALRLAAFEYLDGLGCRAGGFATREQLAAFTFDGQVIPLLDRGRGIRKPWQIDAALSIMTSYSPRPDKRPYDDDTDADGYLRYKWQGTEAEASDNRALRRAILDRRLLIWFEGVAPGIYSARYPVQVVHEDPSRREFLVSLDSPLGIEPAWTGGIVADVDQRKYVAAVVRQRLHQRQFRDRVVAAYDAICAVCHLRHTELLEAAHIRKDSAGGQPVVSNGISLCTLHHGTFDQRVIGTRPDYVVEVRQAVLEEEDGPTLRFAIQGLHGRTLSIPKSRAAWPDKDALQERYSWFQQAG